MDVCRGGLWGMGVCLPWGWRCRDGCGAHGEPREALGLRAQDGCCARRWCPTVGVPQVFDSAGSFLSYINTAADPLYGPQGLALTSDGHVVVADSGNHCFKAYRYLQ